MDNPTAPPDVAELYAAAGIEPGTAIRAAADHIAHLIAENKRLADEIARQTLLAGMTIDRGATQIDVVPTREVVINWVLAARDMLGDAVNYIETVAALPPSVEFGIGTAGERFVVIIQRAGRLSPHQARLRAEHARDQILDTLRARADQEDGTAAALQADADADPTVRAIHRTDAATHTATATWIRRLLDEVRPSNHPRASDQYDGS